MLFTFDLSGLDHDTLVLLGAEKLWEILRDSLPLLWCFWLIQNQANTPLLA